MVSAILAAIDTQRGVFNPPDETLTLITKRLKYRSDVSFEHVGYIYYLNLFFNFGTTTIIFGTLSLSLKSDIPGPVAINQRLDVKNLSYRTNPLVRQKMSFYIVKYANFRALSPEICVAQCYPTLARVFFYM